MWTKLNMWTMWTKLNFINNVDKIKHVDNVDKIQLQQQCEQFSKIERNVQVGHSLVLATGPLLLQLDLASFSCYYFFCN